MIRVGLIFSLRGDWLGGVNYFKNLLNCYRKFPDHEVKLEVFTPHPEDLLQYECDRIAIHPWPEIQPNRLLHIPRRAMRKILGYDPVLVDWVKRHQIDLLAYSSLGAQSSVKALLWQADFQHKRLPQYFSQNDCVARDAAIAKCKRWGNLLLSSHSAASDFRRYYPELQSVKTHVLQFSTAAILDVVPMTRAELESKYPVREPYFYLPNQFWQHKNHAVVIDALAQTTSNIRVICTGSMDDSRNPGFKKLLMERIQQAGLKERFVFLGAVPYENVAGLMHHAIAVLQPSLFEGWSTSVEEAKAMRKEIILSDIDVHLEQAPERGVYFSPESADELAACLERSHEAFSSEIEEHFAHERTHQRQKIEQNWILEFARIIKSVSEQTFRLDT